MLNRFHGLHVDEDTVPMWEHVVARANEFGLAYLHLTEPLSPKQIADTPGALADVGAHFRPLAKMPIISNGGSRPRQGRGAPAGRLCDAVAYGQAWIANPDLVERFRRTPRSTRSTATPSTRAAARATSTTRR
jgi:N-ethylmaleimide reductase